MAQVFTFPKNRTRLSPGLGDVAADALDIKPVSVNAQGPAVRALQSFLVAARLAQPTVGGKPFVTGIYDDATSKAVILLQRMVGVLADGAFNQKTVDALKADVQKTAGSLVLRSAGVVGQVGGGSGYTGPATQAPDDTTNENVFAWLQFVGAIPIAEEYGGTIAQNTAANEVIRSLAAKWGFKPALEGYPFPPGHTGRGGFMAKLRAEAVAKGWGRASGPAQADGAGGTPWLLIGGVIAAGLALAFAFSGKKPTGMGGTDASDIGADEIPAPRRPARKASRKRKAA